MQLGQSHGTSDVIVAGDDITQGELVRWLKAVDSRIEKMDSRVTGLDTRFTKLDIDMRERIDRIDRVSYREFEEARKTDREYNQETRAIAINARNFNWLMFSLIALSLLGAALALIQSA